MSVKYDIESPTYGHSAEWWDKREYHMDESVVSIKCHEVPNGHATIAVQAGWAYVRFCPSCGKELEIKSERQ